MGLKTWFKSKYQKIRDKIRAKLKDLPSLEDIIKERHVYMAALLALGDKASAMEPEDLAQLDYVRQAIQVAEFTADATELIPGLDKLDDVRDAVKLAWRGAGKLDDKFDDWWAKTRPFIDAYVRRARETGYFKSTSKEVK